MALLLNEVRHLKFKKFVQTASYLPHFISSVVVAGMVISFLQPDGLINNIVALLGGKRVAYIMKPNAFPFIYVITCIWKSFGFNSILYLSSMSSIDPCLYESAKLDGATRFQQMRHITFDVITLIYCDYAALIPDERKALLSKIHQALKPNGLFIFDVFTERTYNGKSDNTSWSYHENGGFWSGEPHLCLEAEYYFENNTVKVHKAVVITENNVREYLIWDTVFTKDTLLNEVAPFGFQMHGIYDDVSGSQYTGEADTLCVVLKK